MAIEQIISFVQNLNFKFVQFMNKRGVWNFEKQKFENKQMSRAIVYFL